VFNIGVVLSGLVVSIEKMVFDVLKKSDISLTINEVAERANLHRITASKYLAVLEAKGLLKCRNVGKAKLYYVNNEISERRI
jgi:DNA-binding IclR family transcriptional regulator